MSTCKVNNGSALIIVGLEYHIQIDLVCSGRCRWCRITCCEICRWRSKEETTDSAKWYDCLTIVLHLKGQGHLFYCHYWPKNMFESVESLK